MPLRIAVLSALLGLAACDEGAVDDSADTDSAATDSGGPVDTGEATTDTDDTGAPQDVDDDGFTDDVDCDDFDPNVNPDAEEAWNGTDDDCDGRVDGDGTYTGSMTLEFFAIYEGNPVRRTLVCPGTLERTRRAVIWEMVCEVPADDADARVLMGAELSVRTVENIATDGRFSGEIVVVSSDGWETPGSGTLTWDGFDRVAVTATMRSQGAGRASVDVTGRLELAPDPD